MVLLIRDDFKLAQAMRADDEQALAAAVVWRRFEIPDVPTALLACVLVTVPANKLIATLPTDRMPAFLAADDWATWLGERDTTMDEVKSCLRTVEGVRWTMAKEERATKQKGPRSKPTTSDPTPLF